MSCPASNIDPVIIDAIIKARRKARAPKSCYPCSLRKVKCDRGTPCGLCVKRGHEQLCSYTHPCKHRRVGSSQAAHHAMESSVPSSPAPDETVAETVSFQKEEWNAISDKIEQLETTIAGLRTTLEQVAASSPTALDSSRVTEIEQKNKSVNTNGVHLQNVSGSSAIHFGPSSLLAFISSKFEDSTGTEKVVLGERVLPQLALGNEVAPYPFLDLWSPDVQTYHLGAICAALPSDSTCRELFRCYRDIRAVLCPVLFDIKQLEDNMEELLRGRAFAPVSNMVDPVSPFGVDITFLAVLFSVLASGCQVSDLPSQERILSSQVYVSCSYQCLRMTNYVSYPTIKAIQTLLIIGDVLSTNLNPGASYILFGMTQRMALALGLHAQSASFSSDRLSLRRRLWWSMAWQDSHFALCYDRPSEISAQMPNIPYEKDSRPGNRSYFETVCRVTSLTLQMLHEETTSPELQVSRNGIRGYKAELQRILADATPHLRHQESCVSTAQHMERLTLKIRSSYLISELCRRSVKSASCPRKQNASALCEECVEGLLTTVLAYVELHKLVPHSSRCWSNMNSAISSAYLLAVNEGSQSRQDVWEMIGQLEDVLRDMTSADLNPSTDSSPFSCGTDALESPTSLALNRTASQSVESWKQSDVDDMRGIEWDYCHGLYERPMENSRSMEYSDKVEWQGKFLERTLESLQGLRTTFAPLKGTSDFNVSSRVRNDLAKGSCVRKCC